MTAARFLMAGGLAAAAFGYWGVYTKAGQRQFDEMAGILPFFSLVAGTAALFAGVAMFAYLKWRHPT